MGHISEIDHLRGLAILLTLIAHIASCLVAPEPWLTWVYRHAEFWGGVYLFFVISGFVITRGFFNALAAHKNLRSAWIGFYARRFFRIVPTAMVAIASTLTIALLFNQHGSFGSFDRNVIQAVAAALFSYNLIMPLWTQTFSVFWSLALEEQFYLLFPMLCRMSARLRYLLLLAPIIALAYVRRPAGSVGVFLPVDALCLGVLIAIGQLKGWLRACEPTILNAKPLRRLLGLSLLFALILVPVVLKPYRPATSIMALICGVIVLLASYNRGYALFFDWEWLRKLGLASYSAYVWHMTAFLMGREIAMAGISHGLDPRAANGVSVSVGLLLAGALTWAAYRWVEVPSRQLSRNPNLLNGFLRSAA